MNNKIRIQCVGGQASGEVPADFVGKQVRCKKCGQRVVVPAPVDSCSPTTSNQDDYGWQRVVAPAPVDSGSGTLPESCEIEPLTPSEALRSEKHREAKIRAELDRQRGTVVGARAAPTLQSAEDGDPAARAEAKRLIATITTPCDGRSRGDPISVAKDRLLQIGRPAVPTVLAALPRHKGWPLIYLIDSLREIGDRRAIDPLFGLLTIANEEVQVAALTALVQFGDARAFDGLVRLAQNATDHANRGSAIEGLGKLGDARGVDALLVVLRDQNAYLRADAAKSLGQIGDPRAQAGLTKAASQDAEGRVQKAAREALQRIDPGAVKATRVSLDPNGCTLYDLLHSGRTFTVDNPIILDAPDAVVYRAQDHRSVERWFLGLPTGCRVREKREIMVDPEKNPDRFVVEAIRAAPNWRVGTIPDGSLYRLIQSGWLLDYQNPILIGDVGYLYFDERGKKWELRVPIDQDSARHGQGSAGDHRSSRYPTHGATLTARE
jgi:hypothetical protein